MNASVEQTEELRALAESILPDQPEDAIDDRSVTGNVVQVCRIDNCFVVIAISSI